MTTPLLVLPRGPPGQRALQLPPHRVQCRAIIPPILLEPAPDLRVAPPRQIVDRLVAAERQLPVPHLRPYRLARFLRHRRAAVQEGLPLPGLRPPGARRLPQNIARLVRVRPSPLIILARDTRRLLWRKLQPACLPPRSNGGPYLLGLRLCSTRHERLIGLPCTPQVRRGVPPPPVEGVVQKQMRQQGTTFTPLSKQCASRPRRRSAKSRWARKTSGKWKDNLAHHILRPICRRLCATSARAPVRAAGARNCPTDEGRPLGTSVQERVPTHLRLRWSKAMVVSAGGKGLGRTRSGDWQEEDRKGTTEDVSKA
jgi:hypothetical protein